MRYYLDASILAAVFLNEDYSITIRDFLIENYEQLIVSVWTSLETVSAITQSARRGDITHDHMQNLLQKLQELIDGLPKPLEVRVEHYQTAAFYLKTDMLKLRTGDALHLAIAKDIQNATLLTNDRLLLAAAKQIMQPAMPIGLTT